MNIQILDRLAVMWGKRPAGALGDGGACQRGEGGGGGVRRAGVANPEVDSVRL